MVLPAVTDLAAAVRASLGLLDLNVTIAAATWRAPLIEFCPVAYSAFTAGPTGCLKSASWGVAQAHWGAYWDGVRFAANWSGTVNSIEKIAFLAKDALLVVDDFAPSGARRAVTELHEKAERLLRAAGNLAGRSRMNADTSLRHTYWPRGQIASSGEDVPGGHSLRARMAIEQFGPNDIDSQRLKVLQDAARGGVLAQAMAGFVQWLARLADGGVIVDDGELRQLGEHLRQRQTKLRGLITGEHRRTPDTTAALALGVDIFLAFAVQVGAIDKAESDARFASAWQKLLVGAAAQGVEQREEDPVHVFIEAIPAVLASGIGHVASRDGIAPEEAHALGWRRMSTRYDNDDGEGRYTESSSEWRASGDLIGWVDGDDLMLLPDAAIRAANALLRGQGATIVLKRNTLGKRLREAGWLTSMDQGTFTKLVAIGAERRRVLMMSRQRVL
jgi:hypothetical protein